MDNIEQPDGIVITISRAQIAEHGYRHWLRNFLEAMEPRHEVDEFYCMRVSNQPKAKDLQYVYLCIGGKIRWRAYYGGSSGPRTIKFTDDREMSGRAWIYIGGPVTRAPHVIKRQGTQGFRYTKKLF